MDWKVVADDSGEERERVKGIIRSLLPSAIGMVLRSSVEVFGERIVAMTVVLGRRRREVTRPSPIPT